MVEAGKGAILVVDDRDTVRYVTSRLLREGGHIVREACTGRECIHSAITEPPDAILLDVNLPDLNGFEVAEQLRRQPSLAHVGLLHMSASVISPEAQAHSLIQGADGFIVLPAEPQILLATVKAVLRVKRAEKRAKELLEMEQKARSRAEASEAMVRALNVELQAALKSRDDFLSMVSHEIKTPVTAVQVMVATLRRRLQKGNMAGVTEVLGDRLETVYGQMERLVRMLDTLLDLGALSAGRITLRSETVDLVALCRDVVARYSDESAAARRPVTVILPEEPVVGVWDRVRLDQVLTNLISNAFKYGETGGIEVGLCAESGQVKLWVLDHGRGIPVADQRRIFERFERVDGQHHKSGFGVGLWVVQKIVDAFAGQVSVKSAADQGSCFTVLLPRTVVNSAEMDNMTRHGASGTGL